MKKLLFVMVLALGVVALMTPPAMAQEEKPFTLHGEARFRGDYNANTSDFNDDSGVDDGSFWPYRIRIAAEGHFSKNVTAWIEFQNASVFGGDFSPVKNGHGEVDEGGNAQLYQGNITIDGLWNKNFSLRMGRQEIVAGTELLLGDLDFYAGQSFDGFTGSFKLKKGTVMLLATRISEGQYDPLFASFLPAPGAVGFGGSGVTSNFYGAYTTWNIPMNSTLDAYLLNLKAHGNFGIAGDFDVMTIGARWSKDVVGKNGLFWNIEHAMQSGDADTDIDAKGSVTEGWIGWNFKSGKNNHRVYAKLEAASGDDDPANTDEDGFIPLFGDFHNRVGHGDWFFLSGNPTSLAGGVGDLGLQAVALGWTGRFGDKHELGAELWQVATSEDNVAGEDSLGSEIDVFYNYIYSKNLVFSGSLSQLSPDDGLTGGAGAPDDSVTRLYGNARFRF